MRLCDWCEQPTPGEDQDLCIKCADAREKVAAGKIFPAPVEKEKKKELSAPGMIWGAFVFLAKLAAAGALSLVLVGAALFGTCSALIAVFGVLTQPMMAVLYAVLAAVAFGVSMLMLKLITSMFQAPPTLTKNINPELLKTFDKPAPAKIPAPDPFGTTTDPSLSTPDPSVSATDPSVSTTTDPSASATTPPVSEAASTEQVTGTSAPADNPMEPPTDPNQTRDLPPRDQDEKTNE